MISISTDIMIGGLVKYLSIMKITDFQLMCISLLLLDRFDNSNLESIQEYFLR